MKKIVGVFGAFVLASLTGCATEEYIRNQVAPLAERLGKLEAKVTSQPNEMSEADKAAIRQANDKAQQALDLGNKLMGDVKKVDNDVRKADNGAKKAEAAAARAEIAAKEAERAAKESRQLEKRSERMFKLEQKK